MKTQHLRAVLFIALLADLPLAQALTCTDGTIPPSNPESAYIVNSDDTVSDTRNGLMWKRCTEGQKGSACSGSATSHPWKAALGLAAASSFAGYHDWRLPNINELASLVEDCRTAPAINNNVFPATPSSYPNSYFWSGSPFADSSYVAWGVVFDMGSVGGNNRSDDGSVRLVRGGQSFGSFDRWLPAQTISFSTTPILVVGGTSSLSATASSGLPVTFSSLTVSICTVAGNTVTGIATGTCTVAANQTGDNTFSPAPQATQSFSSTISFPGKVIEFYHSTLKHYFLTLDPGEAAGIDAGAAGPGWTRTGGSFNVDSSPVGNSQPVCRFYGSVSPGPNSHFFTVNAGECDGLRAQQASTPETMKKWHYEGTAFYIAPPLNAVCAEGSAPIDRYYNNGYVHGEDSNHRLTTDASLRASMEAAGWSYEGVVMCSTI